MGAAEVELGGGAVETKNRRFITGRSRGRLAKHTVFIGTENNFKTWQTI